MNKRPIGTLLFGAFAIPAAFKLFGFAIDHPTAFWIILFIVAGICGAINSANNGK